QPPCQVGHGLGAATTAAGATLIYPAIIAEHPYGMKEYSVCRHRVTVPSRMNNRQTETRQSHADHSHSSDNRHNFSPNRSTGSIRPSRASFHTVLTTDSCRISGRISHTFAAITSAVIG